MGESVLKKIFPTRIYYAPGGRRLNRPRATNARFSRITRPAPSNLVCLSATESTAPARSSANGDRSWSSMVRAAAPLARVTGSTIAGSVLSRTNTFTVAGSNICGGCSRATDACFCRLPRVSRLVTPFVHHCQLALGVGIYVVSISPHEQKRRFARTANWFASSLEANRNNYRRINVSEVICTYCGCAVYIATDWMARHVKRGRCRFRTFALRSTHFVRVLKRWNQID